MRLVSARQLPGVRFEAQPLVAEALPRMDVAAFVGFASSGPLHCPVAVESLAEFESLFGEAPVLAWDGQRGEPVRAHLASAVWAFFQNGGRRCLVVRVAGPGALSNRFQVPGLMRCTPDGQQSTALARARSEGSWSDPLQVAATLSSEVLELVGWGVEGTRVELTVTATDGVAPGDLLRLTLPGSGQRVMVPVQEVHPVGPLSRDRAVRVVSWSAIPLGKESNLVPGPRARCERLTLGLWTRLGTQPPMRLEGLGFCPGHPRFWGALPTDEELARQEEPGPFTLQDASGARFPLAGPPVGDAVFYFPLGMEALPSRYLGCEASLLSPHKRDGLKEFGAELFLDEALQGLHSEALLAQASFLRDQSSPPRALRGIYSLLSKEEVTLVTVPDAVHRAWSLSDVPGLGAGLLPEMNQALESTGAYSDGALLAVQRALLRLCHARGDVLCVLALPEHYREEQALRHAARLRAPFTDEPLGVPALDAAEESALSHGALYHPWPLISDEARPRVLSRMPPDGAACGVMARRALLRGAWTAPANEPWHGVLALTPPLSEESWEGLQEAGINILRRQPEDFRALSADTLAADPELRPVSVRRLLTLLRRAALRLGVTWLFEPNDPAFHRLVQRGFEALLGELFTRGAFAGTTRDKAFQVLTEGGRNTPTTEDQGQFFVDLKVAPSTPLVFLNVRLVQSGDRGLRTEER